MDIINLDNPVNTIFVFHLVPHFRSFGEYYSFKYIILQIYENKKLHESAIYGNIIVFNIYKFIDIKKFLKFKELYPQKEEKE